MTAVTTYLLGGDGQIPNNPHCPVLLYPQAVPIEGADPARAFEMLFNRNMWPAAWRNGIFSYHHFHCTAHEVLGIYSGSVHVQLGGANGVSMTISSGDIVVIPAGVAHKKLDSHGHLGVVGAYPFEQQPDLCRPQQHNYEQCVATIAQVPLPHRDPVQGDDGALIRLWRDGRG